MIYFWMTLAAMGGFALGVVTMALPSAASEERHPTPEPNIDVAARIAQYIRSTYVEDDGIALDETRAARAARHEGGTQDV